MKWRDRKIETVRMRVGDVLPHPMNPKIHPESQLAPLRGLLETVGKLDSLKAYRSARAGGALVFFDGHGRQSLDPDAEWDIDIYDLSDAEADLAVATFDPIGWQAEQSRARLDELLREVSTGDAALLELLAKEAEAAGIAPPFTEKAPGAGGDEFDTTPDEEQTRVRCGDLWRLGEHRVLCGDSTKAEDVDKLLGGEAPVLLVTDPPYGVNYDPAWREGVDLGVGQRSKGKVANDDRTDWADAYRLSRADIAYVWHAGRYAREVAESLQSVGYEVVCQIIWAKQHFVLSRGDYHWQHEPCLYAVKKGAKHNWQGARDQSTLWQIKNNNSFGNAEAEKTWGHGTQKPVECMQQPVLNNSAAGDVVIDLFGGSGTTLIACERTNRKARVVEIEPKYVNVILSRWEAETGREAILLECPNVQKINKINA
ncbi:MAG TPA: DNA methyltransferase [Candidatus Binatia bacterium]|jgi:DNA modification methylase